LHITVLLLVSHRQIVLTIIDFGAGHRENHPVERCGTHDSGSVNARLDCHGAGTTIILVEQKTNMAVRAAYLGG